MKNDIEKAIEAIKNNYPPKNYTMLREGLTLAIEALQEKQEREKNEPLTWIPVTERLPAELIPVLAFGKSDNPNRQGFDVCWIYCGTWTSWHINHITHWMSLPKPSEVTE